MKKAVFFHLPASARRLLSPCQFRRDGEISPSAGDLAGVAIDIRGKGFGRGSNGSFRAFVNTLVTYPIYFSQIRRRNRRSEK